MADRTWTEFLRDWLAWSQGHVVEALEAADDDLIRVRPSTAAPSIGFHAWHLARWADRHAAQLPVWTTGRAPGEELWTTRGLATAWGFGDRALGEYGIGAGLDDDASAALPLPSRDELGTYARDAFDAFHDAVAAIDDDATLRRRVTDLYGDVSTIGEVIAGVISHTDRHLGMMEALRGVLGERGTATV